MSFNYHTYCYSVPIFFKRVLFLQCENWEFLTLAQQKATVVRNATFIYVGKMPRFSGPYLTVCVFIQLLLSLLTIVAGLHFRHESDNRPHILSEMTGFKFVTSGS